MQLVLREISRNLTALLFIRAILANSKSHKFALIKQKSRIPRLQFSFLFYIWVWLSLNIIYDIFWNILYEMA